MKKKVLAMLLGGAMAVGGLSMQVPITAQAITGAECGGHSEKHIYSCEITDAGGPVEVSVSVSFDAEDAVFNIYALETQLEKQPRPGGEEDYFVIEEWQAEGGNEDQILKVDGKKGIYYVFSGLTGGKTYYFYGVMMDRHELQPSEDSGEHYSTYLGSATPVCGYTSEEHITGYALTPGAGQLTVTIGLQEFKGEYGCVFLYALEKKAEKKRLPYEYESVEPSYHINYDWREEGSQEELRIRAEESGAYTFTGLKEGKTYYVYAIVYDPHFQSESESVIDEHDLLYLGASDGSSDSAASDNNNATSDSNNATSDSNTEPRELTYEEKVVNQILTAQPGTTIVMEKGVSSLPNIMMKALLLKGDVSLKLDCTYKDKEYVIIIPAGQAIDDSVPFYDPLYLAQRYGNLAETENSEAERFYIVKSGDCMSKIAAANNMTLKQLMAKNPQIKNSSIIFVGQRINL